MRTLIKKLLPSWLLTILKEVRYIWIICLFHIFHLLPINKSKIVVCNVWGFGDNAKYVTEELLCRKIELEEKKNRKNPFTIYFITNNPKSAYAPEGIKVLKTNSIRAIFALATGKVWVDNNRKESYIRKRKGQYYIQTWHGGIALKKIEKDYEEQLGAKYVANAKRDSKMADLYVSNSSFCTNMYRNSFWYDGEILECGSPRNDILIQPNSALMREVRNRLEIDQNVHIALYAPTYREGNNTKPYEIDFHKLLHVLENKFSGNWIIAVRLHPLVSEQSSFITYHSQIINASHYRDIYELMAAADLLITDYSNIMFEFSFMKRPVLLYALDEAEYTKDRGFYFEYAVLPFLKANREEELFNHIADYNPEEDQEKVQKFLDTLTIYETGEASKQVVNKILDVIDI
ncbi:CDP-glycerol glycerophosphotransferase family protein [Anaerocolumna sp.]|uniref:CDP-glycerol glycerophosphotransferase family protein n=1 Tax=Anaerocolumna sp. TaxID=2041569 RepID=UPI0028ADE210|nr:CDP-glycerol glycerophosphotransferase family protein [Anaerocolumna sp.]